MAEQYEAITGRRVRSPYQSMITAQAAHLPEVYAAKERREHQEEVTEQREKEFSLAEERQKLQEKEAKKAGLLSMVGTGASIGAIGGPAGAAIGGAIGLGVGIISSFF